MRFNTFLTPYHDQDTEHVHLLRSAFVPCPQATLPATSLPTPTPCPHPLPTSPLPYLGSRQPLDYFLSPHIIFSYFREFDIHGLIQYELFCV